MNSITEKAPAKLNLSLDVLDRRPDGYHNMLMVMQTVSLFDDVRVTLREDGRITVATDLRYLPNDGRNIAWKAASAFFAAKGCNGLGADIVIKKRIPVCAGMGGGSADGAAVLRALNTLTGAELSDERLRGIAAQIGSDTVFCVAGGTSLAEGRGELLTAMTPLEDCDIIICKPKASVSTPALFSRLDSASIKLHPDTRGLVSAIEDRDLRGTAQRVFNVFERFLPPELEDVQRIKSTLLSCGAMGAAMTGTGSAVFGIFDSGDRAGEAFSALSGSYKDVFRTKPCK